MSALMLCENGQFAYQIVAEGGETVCFAAAEIQKYIRQVAGVELPIVGRRSGPAIRLNVTGFEEERDAHTVAAEGNDVIITGSNPRSVLFGAYAFLEKVCGVRFFSPDFECVPTCRCIEVPLDLRIDRTADFAVRTLRAELTMNVALVDWAAKNRFNAFSMDLWRWDGSTDWVDAAAIRQAVRVRGLTLEGSGHSMCYFLNGEKYYDQHPEWFPEVDGQRVRGKYTGDNFCYSNSEALEQCTRNVIAFLKQIPEMTRLSIWPGDGGARCRCERCRDKPFMVLYGNAIKHIRRCVQAELPGVEIYQEAYNFDSQERPLTVENATRTLQVPTEHHDLPTLFAFWGQDLTIPLAQNPEPGHRRFHGFLQDYCSRNPQGAYIFSMHTDTFMLSNLCPVFVSAMAEDFREFKRLGIDKMFLLWIPWNTESEQNMEWVAYQNGALWARMAEDMNFDAVAYRRDYYRWAFGESQAAKGEQCWDRLNSVLNPLQALVFCFPWNRSTDAWGLGWNRQVPRFRWQLATDLGEKGRRRIVLFGRAAEEMGPLIKEIRSLSDKDLPEAGRFKAYGEHCAVRIQALPLLFKAQEAMQAGLWSEAQEYLQQALATGMADERNETTEWLTFVQNKIKGSS